MSETPDKPANGGPHRTHVSVSMDGIELFYLRNLASTWQQLSATDRAAFVNEYVWLRDLHRKMDAAEKEEKNETANRRWKLTFLVAVAALAFTGINVGVEYFALHAVPAAPQTITVKLPGGQAINVTPDPSPTGVP